jgi:hypothetical protein
MNDDRSLRPGALGMAPVASVKATKAATALEQQQLKRGVSRNARPGCLNALRKFPNLPVQN